MTRSRDTPTKWKEKVFVAGAVLLMIMGLLFIFENRIGQSLVKFDSHHYSQVSKKQMAQNQKKKVSYDTHNVKALSVVELVKQQTQKQALPVIGLISIPDLKINLPIFQGDGTDTMMYGAGTMKPKQKMGHGNYALASHTIFDAFGRPLESLFGPLRAAKVGEIIELTDKNEVYQYQIITVTQVAESQGNLIQDTKGQPQITLTTCVTLHGTWRWVIQGRYLGAVKFDNSQAHYFAQQFNQYW